MSPPLPSLLIEEGEEWWGRYPISFTRGFRDNARPTQLHEKYLKDDYFPLLGSVPKKFTTKNRRFMDMNIRRFERASHKCDDRKGFGLPVPNVEASYISLGKYAKDIPALDAQQTVALNTAWQWCERHFGPHMQGARVKSIAEVMESVDKSTSPGYPWTRKYRTKKIMFEDWKDFGQYLEEDWERLRDPMYVAVFGNSLKEEIRPREKIDANSIRTFTAGPVEMTVHGNRLFEDMNRKFYASHLQTASVVGFTPLKGGWDRLYRKLKSHPNGFALDESQYDSSLRAYMMWGCAQFRWNMLREEDRTPENLERLLVYYQNLINTVIITPDGVFVRKTCGNPSGSVNTISDNTLILFVLLAFGWIMLAPVEKCSYCEFMQEVALALCGDDNTWSVSNESLVFYNARALVFEWGRLGVITTTDSLDPRPVEELDFLSAFTVFVDGVACPLYNRQKILTSLLYSSHPQDPTYTLIRACAMLRVGWTDPQLRGYLKELISWLIQQYGVVLQNSNEWREALCQIPTEENLRELFLGESRPMVKQGFCAAPRDKIPFSDMNAVGLPQRPRRQRRRRANLPKRARSQLVGPRLPNGRFRSRGQRSRRSINRPRRQRGPRSSRAVRGAGNIMLSAKPFGMGAQNRSVGQRRIKRVQNDEFISAVSSGAGSSGATFANTAYAVNPGNVTTFPWLSGEAQQWEKYRFEFLEFYFEHDVSAFATAGTTGKVIMSFDYDAADAAPTTKQQMLDTEPHADGMPNEDFGITMNPMDLSGRTDLHYIRLAGLPGGADIRLYDVGNLNVATQGITGATTELGELHVRYSCVFEVPVLESDAKNAPANNQVTWFQTTAAEAAGATTVAKTIALATATVNGLAAVNTAGSIVLPAGNYIADFSVSAANSSNDSDGLLVDFQQNGVSLYQTTLGRPQVLVPTAAGNTNQTVAGSVFFSSTGASTSAITLVAITTYSGGAETVSGSLRIIAI